MKDVKPKIKKKQTSFLKNGATIYELVGDKNHLGFIKFDPIAEEIKLVDSVTVGETKFIPPQNDLVENKIIHLAQYPHEYGDLIKLFEAIKYFINKYVDIPESYLIISTLYVLLTWVYDCFDAIPYLRVIGDYGTGKSRFLQVVGSISYRACFAGGATTTSPIFRIIELYKGVSLIFDEADFRFSGADADIVKILNCGYMRGMPVLRTEGDGNSRQPKGFDVYGPKIIATRFQFQDIALESRCLTQVMAGRPRADIPRHLPKDFYKEAKELRNKLLMFRLKNYGQIEIDPSLEIKGLEPRINQVALPILSIIEDENIRDQVRESLSNLQGTLNNLKRDQEPALILIALVELIKAKSELLGYKEIAEKINEIEGVKSDFSYSITPTKIGKVNQSVLGIKTHRINGRTMVKPSKSNLEKITNLCERYSVLVDDVDLVDVYLGSDDEASRDDIPEKFQKALL